MIFEGNLVSINYNPDTAAHTYTVTFKVLRIYKGDRKLRTVEVKSTSVGDCTLLIDKADGHLDDKEFIGRHYLLYVSKGKDTYTFDYCKNWVLSDSFIDYNFTNNTYKRRKDLETSGFFKDEITELNNNLKKLRNSNTKVEKSKK